MTFSSNLISLNGSGLSKMPLLSVVDNVSMLVHVLYKGIHNNDNKGIHNNNKVYMIVQLFCPCIQTEWKS